jgi:hypothetical protein
MVCGSFITAGFVVLLASHSLPRAALLQQSDVEPSINLSDLVAQSPEWAPETVEPVSSGFNAWMDTLPFGESERHRRLRSNWERSHAAPDARIIWRDAYKDGEARSPPIAKRSQVQMLRMQALAPKIWTDYTMKGDGVKCVCDSSAAGDPEMEGLDPNVKPACRCSGGRTTQFTNTEEGGPLDTGGNGAWPQGLPGVGGRGDGAAYVDGIVGNNAYKPVHGATLLAAQARASEVEYDVPDNSLDETERVGGMRSVDDDGDMTRHRRSTRMTSMSTLDT